MSPGIFEHVIGQTCDDPDAGTKLDHRQAGIEEAPDRIPFRFFVGSQQKATFDFRLDGETVDAKPTAVNMDPIAGQFDEPSRPPMVLSPIVQDRFRQFVPQRRGQASETITVKDVFGSDGFGGLAATLRHKLTEPILNYWGQDHWWAGRLVELTGNRVHIDGCRFSVNSFAIKTEIKSRFLLGTYEEAERNAIRRFLDPSLPVVEFGASVGVIACLTNHMLKDPRRHVVVEANPALLPLLKANCERNDCRFTVLHSAVAYGSDEVLFYQNEEDYLAS